MARMMQMADRNQVALQQEQSPRQPDLASSNSSDDTVIARVAPASGAGCSLRTDERPEAVPSRPEESKQKQGRLKSLLIFTAHLNPFGQQRTRDQSPSGGLLGLARRLLAGSGSGQYSTAEGELLRPKSSSPGAGLSKSAPVTPLKWRPLDADLLEARCNGLAGEGAAAARCSKRASVRFLESEPATAAGPAQLEPGESPMDSARFRQYGYQLIDYISNYLDTIDKRRVTPLNIEPGYLKSRIQADAPERGDSFANIMSDFESHIMCGITHWQHPHFHAYFPAGNAYPSILADMLSAALGCVGFSWAASPAYTELEIIMLDWMGKMIGLPEEFRCLGEGAEQSKGGGVIQGSASECVLINLLAARHWALEKLRKKHPGTPEGLLLGKLIGYCSKEAHSCVEKAAMVGLISMRALDTDERHSLRGPTLLAAIEQDERQGLEPFLVCATLGTTSCVSFDNLEELGRVCQERDIWLHVDAAYAGSALICPEFKYLMRGIEMASSFNMNPNKWMLINFDCSLMWVKDRFKLTRAFVVDPLYLQHSFSDQAIDYRHWGIALSRRFRALKLWFVIRNYGLEGLRAYIRNHVRLAKLFEQKIRADSRFSITNEVVLGLVCFRLVGSNSLNQRLLSMINASGRLHMVPASLNGRYVIRFCVCDQNAKEADILYAYQCISDTASELFESIRAGRERIRAISQQNTIDVSSVSLHTQQSASADRLNASPDEQQPPVAAAGPDAAELRTRIGSSMRQAARQSLLRGRNSRVGQTLAEDGPVASAGQLPAGELALPSKGPLVKQASMQADSQQEPPDEDLEQEVYLESLGEPAEYEYDYDYDYDYEDDLAPEVDPREPEARRTGSSAAELGDARSPAARRPPDAQGEHPDEAADELYTLAERRNRMSLRYKREFFVRVVSDPRVYRASISGDINAHSSSSSLGGGGGGGAPAKVNQAASTTSGESRDR